MKKWAWATFWLIAGTGMLVAGIWVEWFNVDFTYFKVNVGWFALVYAALVFTGNVLTLRAMMLTQRELHDWGDALAEATPVILELAEKGDRPREIARELTARYRIPELVSLKYMVALSRVRTLSRDNREKT
jgi:hypothetical protein